MGQLQDQFISLMSETGADAHSSLPRPRTEDVLGSHHADEIMSVYRRLGGAQEAPSLRPGTWDLELDGTGVEFDEHLHFNRYRAETLRSKLYELLPAFPADTYLAFCQTYEQSCLQAGSYAGKWSNRSCEAQFGPAGSHRDLSGSGAPRWKQRAFYDYMKDLSPLLIGTRMARIAIWDELHEPDGMRTVEEAVSRPMRGTREALISLIHQRAA